MEVNKVRTGLSLLVVIFTIALIVGCGSNEDNSSGPTGVDGDEVAGNGALESITIGHSGSTCEASTFAAYEKGFFEEEGLDVELIRGDFTFLKDNLGTGGIDAVNGLSLSWIKPLEQGVNAKATTGVHKGCLYALVLAESEIYSIADLKGKSIGVPTIGSPQMMILSRALAYEGIDIQTEVEWKAFPAAELELAIKQGEVDAIAVGEPFGTTLQGKEGEFRSLLNQSEDSPYADEYCCVYLVNGTIIERRPEVAAAITRAIIRGAEYTQNNPEEMAEIMVDRNYVAGTVEVNGEILRNLDFTPNVDAAYDALYISYEAGKEIGVIDAKQDVKDLTDRAFIKLPGLE